MDKPIKPGTTSPFYPSFIVGLDWPLRFSSGLHVLLAWLEFYNWKFFHLTLALQVNTVWTFHFKSWWVWRKSKQMWSSCFGQEHPRNSLSCFYSRAAGIELDKKGICDHSMQYLPVCPNCSVSSRTSPKGQRLNRLLFNVDIGWA